MVLARFAGCCRSVWDKALARKNERLDTGMRTLSYLKLAALFKEWKAEFTFLKDAPSQALQQTLMNLDRAIKDAFDKTSPKKFPVFKMKGKHDSFRIPQGFDINSQAGMLPKIGWTCYCNSRDLRYSQKHDDQKGSRQLVRINPS